MVITRAATAVALPLSAPFHDVACEIPKSFATLAFPIHLAAILAMWYALASARAMVLRGTRQPANQPWVALEAAATLAVEAAAVPPLESHPQGYPARLPEPVLPTMPRAAR